MSRTYSVFFFFFALIEMIAEKPVWVKHEGLQQIFSIDVQPNGERFATGGGDHKVSPFLRFYCFSHSESFFFFMFPLN